MADMSKRYLSPTGLVTTLPYFISANDRVYETSTLTETDLKNLKWYVLKEINDEFDPDIQIRVNEVLNKKAKTLTYEYKFRENAREVMIDRIDAVADRRRADCGGDTEEHKLALEEARARIQHEETPTKNSKFPFLEADIGRSIDLKGNVIQTTYSAACLIIELDARKKKELAKIREWRLAAKAAIRDAETDEAAYELFKVL